MTERIVSSEEEVFYFPHFDLDDPQNPQPNFSFGRRVFCGPKKGKGPRDGKAEMVSKATRPGCQGPRSQRQDVGGLAVGGDLPDLKGAEAHMKVCNQKRQSNRVRKHLSEIDGRVEGKGRVPNGPI